MARILVLPEAADEVARAAEYIEEERSGFGVRFLDAYAAVLEQMVLFANSGSRLSVDDEQSVRGFWIRPFGYQVICTLMEESLVIVVVAHSARQPGYWRARLG